MKQIMYVNNVNDNNIIYVGIRDLIVVFISLQGVF